MGLLLSEGDCSLFHLSAYKYDVPNARKVAAGSMQGAPFSPGHPGCVQSSMRRGSTNPANYTASSHRTSPHDIYTGNHTHSSSTHHARKARGQGAPRGLPMHAHGMTTFEQTAISAIATVSQPPTNSSNPDEIKAWVEHQLDVLGNTPLLGRFVMVGPHERRRGGTPLALIDLVSKLFALDSKPYLKSTAEL